jgi:hypothetical protein
MMTLQERLKPLRPGTPPTIDLATWIAAWPTVRSQFETLIDEHEQLQPHFHRQWTMSVLETLDESMHELAHRTVWLKERLASLEKAR